MKFNSHLGWVHVIEGIPDLVLLTMRPCLKHTPIPAAELGCLNSAALGAGHIQLKAWGTCRARTMLLAAAYGAMPGWPCCGAIWSPASPQLFAVAFSLGLS